MSSELFKLDCFQMLFIQYSWEGSKEFLYRQTCAGSGSWGYHRSKWWIQQLHLSTHSSRILSSQNYNCHSKLSVPQFRYLWIFAGNWLKRSGHKHIQLILLSNLLAIKSVEIQTLKPGQILPKVSPLDISFRLSFIRVQRFTKKIQFKVALQAPNHLWSAQIVLLVISSFSL